MYANGGEIPNSDVKESNAVEQQPDKDYADRVSYSSESNMAPTGGTTDSNPLSPTASVLSTHSLDMDVKELLRNLPSRTDLATMLGKLETTFQHKMEGLSSEIRQVGRRVQDLEDERGSFQAQIQALSSKRM
ncbi:Hypothetical predicted protein [Pelobates cultripes]|uniref:Uncharacterized protein n=1 Tax=Pelobates cultripes TaxID=61616 RepID=A0AAD1TR39_PELCU|nr:Hypothetical predicted protein [Pelobates cultripes]